ncbi:hypothetical protein A4R35_17710 [Thermogemmatispora tikiterensis]|uniref:Uncharacterized protein n=1 Tax=Thermogemmatispora tikiterensis TaxID=1825093 RepID=A0A328VHF4_9CHLR|nr:hypothetical protein A4R35_17710 [Thermogemmatispora tikiterensis]
MDRKTENTVHQLFACGACGCELDSLKGGQTTHLAVSCVSQADWPGLPCHLAQASGNEKIPVPYALIGTGIVVYDRHIEVE